MDENLLSLRDSERQHIVKTLTRTRGAIGGPNGAARLLGLPRSTLQYRIKKLAIQPRDYLEIDPVRSSS
jgi:transcriptional regulator with GAF, ATPase, and Fis domain